MRSKLLPDLRKARGHRAIVVLRRTAPNCVGRTCVSFRLFNPLISLIGESAGTWAADPFASSLSLRSLASQHGPFRRFLRLFAFAMPVPFAIERISPLYSQTGLSICELSRTGVSKFSQSLELRYEEQAMTAQFDPA